MILYGENGKQHKELEIFSMEKITEGSMFNDILR